MTKLFNLTLTCLMLFSFVACNSDDGKSKDIELAGGGTSTTQTIYADQTSGSSGGLKFATTGAWQATVTKIATKSTSGSDIEWLTLSQYSGDKAGDYTLTLTLKENYTGEDRKATIRITSGNNSITITVEQKGTTQDGKEPEDPDEPIPQRDYKYFITKVKTTIYSESGKNDGESTITFTYNDNKQLIKVEEKPSPYSDNIEYMTISHEKGNINYIINDKCEIPHNTTVVLDKDGRIISGKRNNENEKNDFWDVTYNSNGYLIESIGQYEWRSGSEYLKRTIDWGNGNMISVTDQDGWRGVATYTDIDNNPLVNFDITFLVNCLEVWAFTISTDHSWDSDVFIAANYYGKRNKNYIKTMESEYTEGSGVEVVTYTYQINEQGLVTKVTAKVTERNDETRVFEFTYES